ncbi:hypothetical protein BN140_2256 [Methanoculleus bourgensis MS2]|jgi:hypothetical protein|uniref:Uncharacterized protein n=2 Tax=Methanoculleus bourgensis TaxID=83986 RepID=I7LNK7_METBM|nr:hypothetical protein BN140_2256 [Methanoculleus bourgensis MS2]
MTDSLREMQQAAEPRLRPAVVKPGARTEALSRFLRNGTWRRTIPAGRAGPGSPEMDVVGRVTCERVIDGLWFSCTLEQDLFAGGEKLLTWKSRWVAGWDVAAQEYRAAGFDSNSVAAVF